MSMLYHGTSYSYENSIKEKGLIPRNNRKIKNMHIDVFDKINNGLTSTIFICEDYII